MLKQVQHDINKNKNTMKNLLLLLPIAFLFSCKEQAKQPETAQPAAQATGWTKPMMIAVDAPTTYFDDVDDVDFSEYSKLIHEVFQEVYAGKLQAYNFMDGTPLTVDEIKKAINPIDTMYAENPETKAMEMKIIVSLLDEGITSVKVKETWHFNKETLQLEKKVLGIAPRMEVVNPETGEIKGYTPLFWVFFDKQAEQNFINQFKTNS
jgi:hypothetical protein